MLHCVIKWSVSTSHHYTVASWCAIVSSQCSSATTVIYGVTTVFCFAQDAEMWYHNASLCPKNFALRHHNPLFYHSKLHLNATKLQCTAAVPHHFIMVLNSDVTLLHHSAACVVTQPSLPPHATLWYHSDSLSPLDSPFCYQHTPQYHHNPAFSHHNSIKMALFDITVLHVKHVMSVFHHANTTLHFVTTVLCGAITMFNCEMTILYSITLHCDIRKLYCALASHTMTSHCSTVSSLM